MWLTSVDGDLIATESPARIAAISEVLLQIYIFTTILYPMR